MQEIKNVHIIKVKYLPCNEKHGYRVIISSAKFKSRIYRQIHFNGLYETIDLLQKKGFNIIGKSLVENDFDLLISDTFKDIKEIKR